MRKTTRFLKVFGKVFGGLVLFFGILAVTFFGGAGMAGVILLFTLLVNGWAFYAFLRYRQSRQNELAHVLAAATAAGVSLSPAVHSYLLDRPPQSWFRWSLSWLACMLLPLYTYARIWIGWRRYNDLVGKFAARLEQGESLSSALRAVPGVSDRELRLAASIGESTGNLAQSLQDMDRERWSVAWLELAPRFVYPALMMLFMIGIVTFLTVAIIPKFKKIFEEFNEKFPPITQALVNTSNYFADYNYILPIVFWMTVFYVCGVIASPTLRWRTPILGRLYHWELQAEILRALGRLLTAGQTVPQALRFLGSSEDLPSVARHRLLAAAESAEQGESLDIALGKVDLLPENMRPLVLSAQRVLVLPATLTELGDHLSGKAFRLVRRISLIVSPLMVLVIGSIVGFIAVAMFLPLIQLMEKLIE